VKVVLLTCKISEQNWTFAAGNDLKKSGMKITHPMRNQNPGRVLLLLLARQSRQEKNPAEPCNLPS